MRRRLAILAATAALVSLALPGVAGAAATQVVSARVIGAHGTLLVATSNDMTLYTFDKDVAGSGVSSCTGGCLANWPALTIAAGDTPTAGAGVTGTLGTITRTDNGAVQVTYDGLPLYFFLNDTAPGDTNGIYTNWRAVVLAAPAAQSPAPPAVKPPPTSTQPVGGGSSPSGDPLPPMVFAAVAAVGFLVATRRLAATRS
jgi:predicted lipoprotein with Yx(FWY)xxD motif